MSIIQLNPQIQVHTPLGNGWCYLILDYDLQINTIWVVRLDSDGQVRHFDANDIKISGNPMMGLPFLK